MNMSSRISKEKFNMRFHTQIIILLCLYGIKACPSRKRWNGIARTSTLKTTQVHTFILTINSINDLILYSDKNSCQNLIHTFRKSCNHLLFSKAWILNNVTHILEEFCNPLLIKRMRITTLLTFFSIGVQNFSRKLIQI